MLVVNQSQASVTPTSRRDLNEILDEPSAEDFVLGLERYALAHRATQHALLLALAEKRSPRLQEALRVFVTEYYHYSCRFSQYLGGLLSALDEPEHRSAIIRNLAEENGEVDEEHKRLLEQAGIAHADVAAPHPALFRRFLAAADVDVAALAAEAPRLATSAWLETMLNIMCSGDAAQAVAALGPGTEGIVRPMYGLLLRAVRGAWPQMSMRERAFFELHALVDDDHALALKRIAASVAERPGARRSLALGLSRALEARACFFDDMLGLLRDRGLLEEASR